MESYIELYSGSRNNEHVFYVFHFKRRNQPMKVIIHDLGDAVTYTPEKTSEDSVVLYANNQYASCQGCFKCWLKNAGFCIMKDSLQHIGALVGQSDPLIIVSQCCYGGYSSPVKAILDRAIGDSLPFFTWQVPRKKAAPPVSSQGYSDCFFRASERKRRPSAAGRISSRFWNCFPTWTRCAFSYLFMWIAFRPM